MAVGKNIRSAVYEKNEHKDRRIADKADALKQKGSNVQNLTKCPCIDMFNAIFVSHLNVIQADHHFFIIIWN